MKRLRRLAVLAALCGTVVLAGWVGAGLAGHSSFGIDSTSAPIDFVGATSATSGAEHADVPRATALGEDNLSVADIASGSAASSDSLPVPRPAIPVAIGSLRTPDPKRSEVEAAGSVEVADTGSGSAALSDPPPKPQPVTPPVLFAAVSPTDPVQDPARPAAGPVDACAESDVCIDQYLWSLYERTPKVDTIKVEERIKEKIKIKGKTKTVVKTLTQYVTEDFGWKDPKAAQKAGMSLKDYVIGGMDRDFRRKLYKAFRAMDDAGLSPGITSGFRDDYRQELANGIKAAADSSYHGGSRRGGYGHGLAADLVSVKGDTRAERCTWSDILWKWIDAHEQGLGIGRPYLDKDPPHVAPIDGKEYADKRSAARLAGLKKPSPSIEAKDHAEEGGATKAQFAGLQKSSPSIEAMGHADRRSAAKARLAGLKTPSPSIAIKEHPGKRGVTAQIAGLQKPSPPIEAKEAANKRSPAKVFHRSNIYSGAPMPYMQRITWSGVAMHEGERIGHRASHGCVRMPNDFAMRLYRLTKLNTRVIIANSELKPTEFADSHLFVHKDVPPEVASPVDPVDKGVEPVVAKSAELIARANTLTPRVQSDVATPQAAPPAKKQKTESADAGASGVVALPTSPAPTDLTKAAAAKQTPISIFISRKRQRLYIRQDFAPLFDSAVTITQPEAPLGTHVFTALEFTGPEHTILRWNVVSLPGELPKHVRYVEERRDRRGRVRRREIEEERSSDTPSQAPAQVLARIEIPPEVAEAIAQMIIPGSALIVSDQGLGDETGEGTDFIVVTR